LTRELITFLRHGLVGLREEKTNLKREFDMAAAFLAIMKMRMGERLIYSVSLPDPLAGCDVPPAMLISLVENAIKHGVEPSTTGGEISIRASEAPDGVHLVVADTGLGLAQTASAGGGVGLANVRERLAAIYGDAARLEVRENSPSGVIAEIVIPFPVAVSEAAAVQANLTCRSEV
jgi:sensor histidine kinase YesM